MGQKRKLAIEIRIMSKIKVANKKYTKRVNDSLRCQEIWLICIS